MEVKDEAPEVKTDPQAMPTTSSSTPMNPAMKKNNFQQNRGGGGGKKVFPNRQNNKPGGSGMNNTMRGGTGPRYEVKITFFYIS